MVLPSLIGRGAAVGGAAAPGREAPRVNRWLWNRLPEHLVADVFARLPVADIIGLCMVSGAWRAMATTGTFTGVFAQTHPKLLGLMGYDEWTTIVTTKVFDAASNEWLSRKLVNFPSHHHAYLDSMFSSDGGLVCFVPDCAALCPTLVCNPLTEECKTLPLLLDLYKKHINILVQLVVDRDTKQYRVMVVCREKDRGLAADMYDSQTGAWSKMDSGLVYGAGSCKLRRHKDPSSPLVFDCATKELFKLECCLPEGEDAATAVRWSLARDRLVVLHKSKEPGKASGTFVVSEYAWQSSTSKLIKSKAFTGRLRGPASKRHEVLLFASSEFVLVFADNMDGGSLDHRQLIGLHDVSANAWRNISMANHVLQYQELQQVSMCEIRWDVSP